MPPETRNPFQDTETFSLSATHSFSSTSSFSPEILPEPRQSRRPPTESTDQTQTDTSGSHFVCTFCWQPQYPPSKPKLVGSSRISCSTCWKEVLDLSICWVCGEQIVRGEEVVSLGWCFWHKACFGCLLCGRALPVPEAFVDVEQGGSEGEGDGKGTGEGLERGGGKEKSKRKRKRKRKQRGVELERIPLCVDCGLEMEGKSEEKVLERGLETVGRFDGGLSRSRLMRISEATEREREADGVSMRWVSPLVGKSEGERGERGRKRSKLGKKRRSKFGAEGRPLMAESMSWESIDEGVSVDSPLQDRKEERYVSVLDPVYEPAFKPSKTKPLPKWMSLLPSNRKQKSDACPPGRYSHSISLPSKVIEDPISDFPTPETHPTPIAETFYPSAGPTPELPPSLSTNIDEIVTPKPSLAQTESLDRRPPPASPKTGNGLLEVILPPRPAPEQIRSLTKRPPPTFPILRNKALSISQGKSNPFVRAGRTGNPFMRTVSTGNPFMRTVSTGSTVFFTPLEHPVSEPPTQVNSERPAPRKELTSFPFFQSARQPITPAKDSSWSAGLPSSGLLPFKGTPLEPQVSTNQAGTSSPLRPPSRRDVQSKTNGQSAEFLDRYQPLTPSATVKERYRVGEVGSIIDKFEKRRVGRRDRGGEEEKGGEDGGEGGRSGAEKIRDGLRKELKSLFDGK